MRQSLSNVKKALALVMVAGLVSANGSLFALAGSTPVATKPMLDTSRPAPVKGQVTIARDVNMASPNATIPDNVFSVRDADIKDVLYLLAQYGDFNIIIDPSVQGTLTVDISKVSVNKVLEYVMTVADLTYTKDGNTLIVASTQAAATKNLTDTTLKAIPVLYRNASDVEEQLNKTIFSVQRPGGSKEAVVASDRVSNSLLVMGSENDIRMVADALREIDTPPNRKVYTMRHVAPEHVAKVLAETFFNFSQGSGGGGGGGGGGGAGGAGGGGGAAAASSSTSATLPGGVEDAQVLQAGSVKFISDPAGKTLTMIGTVDQIALVDSIIDQFDVQRPQVTVEVALVEVSTNRSKQFKPQFSTMQAGEFTLNLLPLGNSLTRIGWDSGMPRPDESRNNFLGNIDNFSLEYNDSQSKAKIIANPTLVAMDGQAASISITDEVPVVATNVVQNAVGNVITTTVTKQPVGVTFTVTPRVNNDGSVILTMAPSVSEVVDTLTLTSSDPNNPLLSVTTASTVMLGTRSMTMAGVRVMDGQTLVIGGLVRNTMRTNLNKVPFLADLPIVGAFFRSTGDDTNTNNKTELVMMVTPHILKEQGVHYFNEHPGTNPRYNSPNNMHPVGLPKYSGKTDDYQHGGDTMPLKTQKNPAADMVTPVSNTTAPTQAAAAEVPLRKKFFGFGKKGKTQPATAVTTEEAPAPVADAEVSMPAIEEVIKK